MTEPLHWPNVPPIAWPPRTIGVLLVQLFVPMSVFLAGTLWTRSGAGFSNWFVVVLVVHFVLIFSLQRAIPTWQIGRVVRRIRGGAAPWDAAEPWRHRSFRTFEGRGVRDFLLFVPTGLLFTFAFMQRDWLLYAAFVSALPLAVVALRDVLRGRVVVHWLQMPCAVGTEATFTVSMDKGGSDLAGIVCRLRCVKSELTFNRVRKGRVIATCVPVGDAPEAAGPGEEVVVRFAIPVRSLGTDLTAEEPIHWELAVAGRTQWGRVAEVVPVPVYAVPA